MTNKINKSNLKEVSFWEFDLLKGLGSECQIESAKPAIVGKAKFEILCGSNKIL